MAMLENHPRLLTALVIVSSAVVGLHPAYSQDFVAAESVGGPDLDRAVDLSLDGDGNLWVAGWFRGSIDVDPGDGVHTLTSAGRDDTFILKLDTDGDLLWAGHLSGPENVLAMDIEVSGGGFVFVTGQFAGTADVDPGAGDFPLTSSSISDDVFVLQLDLSGHLMWAHRVGGAKDESPAALATNAKDSVVITGSFRGEVDFDPGPGFYYLVSQPDEAHFHWPDVFVLQLDESGEFDWAVSFGGSGIDEARDLAIDPTGDLYVVGTFTGTSDLDPGPGISEFTSDETDSFIVKLDATGKLLRAGHIGGEKTESIRRVTTDSAGNLVAGGGFSGTLDLDPGPKERLVTSSGQGDMVLLKLDSAGALLWGHTLSSGVVSGLTFGAGGEVYSTGRFSGFVDFAPGPREFQLFGPTINIRSYVLNLDADGEFEWAAQLDGSTKAVQVGREARVYTIGSFSQPADLDPGPGVFTLAPVGSWDLFLSTLLDVEAAPVEWRVPLEVPTIQEAIERARHFDTIRVSPGTYYENLDFLGKHVRLTSESGPRKTVIDGSGAGPVVTFENAEGRSTVLEGFTLRNGKAQEGGGVHMAVGASPTLTANVISENQGCSAGGGLSSHFGAPVIRNNLIYRNSRWPGCSGGRGGGGVAIAASFGALLEGNTISENIWTDSYARVGSGGGGVSLYTAGDVVVKDNLIVRNRAAGSGGGILQVNTYSVSIIQNLIVENTASMTGGGIYWSREGPLLLNNTVANNSSDIGPDIFAVGSRAAPAFMFNNIVSSRTGQATMFCEGEAPVFRFNDIFSAAGTAFGGSCEDESGVDGNISADPLFSSPSALDYRLRPGSPAVDTGDNGAPALPQKDLSGQPRIVDGNKDGITVIDIGAYELAPGQPPPGCALGPEVLVLDSPPEQAVSLYRACVMVSAGLDFIVGPGQDVTFFAGRLVTLRDGLAVEDGGTLRILLDGQSVGN